MAVNEQMAAASPAVARRIWGTMDTILLIFAGSAAEFALNKAVDWLFVTGALPDAPVERFFETVRFAQAMVFGDPQAAAAAVRAVNAAHRHVEAQRERRIPQWAHRDTLFMLIDYSERAHRIVFGPMTGAERLRSFEASRLMGERLGIRGVPPSYEQYLAAREQHLRYHLARTELTDRLYGRYAQVLGPVRMRLLLDLQASLTPAHVRRLLGLPRRRYMDVLLGAYRQVRGDWLLWLLSPLLLPGHGAALRDLARAAVRR